VLTNLDPGSFRLSSCEKEDYFWLRESLVILTCIYSRIAIINADDPGGQRLIEQIPVSRYGATVSRAEDLWTRI